jgi:uncharacterized protein
MWYERDIAAFLVQQAQTRPLVLLTGSRQTGKTELLERVFPKFGYVSLDVPQVAEQAESAGEEFLRLHPPPYILDEVQYAPALFRNIKALVDRKRGAFGLYLLTGSQKFELMEGAVESLAGRITVVDLYSLSLREIAQSRTAKVSREQVLEWMFMGGYPELHARGLSPQRFYADYVTTYLERDVRTALGVRNLRDFDRFLRLLASRTGQLVSISALAGDLGMSPNTAKEWLSALEASNLICIVEPFYRNIGKRLVKTPKMYFTDTGLAAYLCGFRSPEELGNSQLVGAFFETLVCGQILRAHANAGVRAPLYFYRDHAGHEVDFVIPVGEKLKLFEVKWADAPNVRIPAFEYVEGIVGTKSVLSKTVIVPSGPARTSNGIMIDDCMRLRSLDDVTKP